MNRRKRLSRFFLVGVSAVGVDLAIYTLLMGLGVGSTSGKGASFLCGVFYSYLLNKIWTFESKESSRSSMPRYLLLYSLTLGLNMAANAFALYILTGLSADVYIHSFLIATILSAIANYVGMRYYVFNTRLNKA